MYANGVNGTSKVPAFQKAMLYDKPGEISALLNTIKVPEPGPGEILVNLTHSGVCFSDLAVMTNSWGDISPGQVGGHEGVGTVVAFGSDTERFALKLGDRVGGNRWRINIRLCEQSADAHVVKWMHSTCGICTPCLNGLDGCCVNGEISGFGTPGTFQQYVVAPANYVTSIPNGLPSELAAPILCGGLTVYSALKKSGAQPGDWVVIPGAGGGLGHLAIQIGARVMGYRMIVRSNPRGASVLKIIVVQAIDAADKEDFCRACGADIFFNASEMSDETTASSRILKATSEMGATAVVVCAASNAVYAQALSFLCPGGTLVCVGVPKGDLLPIGGSYPGKLVNKQLKIIGSTVGNREDAREIVEMAARGLVIPNVKVERMENLTSVFLLMLEGKLQGRVVLDLT